MEEDYTASFSSESSVSEQTLVTLKKQVLEDQMGFLCEELGDPGRYFPHLRSQHILEAGDCQVIRSKVTFKDKTQELIDMVKDRQSKKGEHAFDVLVEAFKKGRVQAHIARALQRALVKAKEDVIRPNGVEISDKPFAVENSTDAYEALPNAAEESPFTVDPNFGALPPPPPTEQASLSSHGVFPPPPAGAYSHSNSGEHSESYHPQHGLLPDVQEDTRKAKPEEGFQHRLSGSEYELGGQSIDDQSQLVSSELTVGAMTLLTSSSDGGSSTLLSGYSRQEDAMKILKLEARIDDLTHQLERAQAENLRKDAEIQSLYKQLNQSQVSQQPVRPHNLPVNNRRDSADSQQRIVTSSPRLSPAHMFPCKAHYLSDEKLTKPLITVSNGGTQNCSESLV